MSIAELYSSGPDAIEEAPERTRIAIVVVDDADEPALVTGRPQQLTRRRAEGVEVLPLGPDGEGFLLRGSGEAAAATAYLPGFE